MSTENLDMVMPFGKYKGKLLSQIPDGYLIYLYDRNKFSGILKEYVEENVRVLKYLKEKKTK